MGEMEIEGKTEMKGEMESKGRCEAGRERHDLREE